MSDVKYTNDSPRMSTPPVETEIRTTESTEAGHTGTQIQHVIVDNGSGANKSVDGKMRVSSMPYLYDIAEGNVSGHTAWFKIGYSPTMTSPESVVWSKAGAYVFPAAPGIRMAVASSSITDDIAAGAGCQQVTIEYLDAGYVTKTEVVTLDAADGQTKVNTVASDILRVNSFRVTRAGANGKPTGSISLTNTGGTVTYSFITAGYTRARNSVFTVPDGKILYVVEATLGYGHATNQTHYARLFIRANQNNEILIAGIYYPFAEVISHGGSIVIPYSSPIKFVQHVDVFVGGVATTSGIATSVMRGWLE